jgi:hypothetical protein
MTALIFLVGALTGILAGGAVCFRYFRAAVADDIGPQLKRMQNQLDNIESAVNLALASRYAELSQLSWPAAIPAPRGNDEGRR